MPYADHLGIDRQREFNDAGEARKFRYALRYVEDGKKPKALVRSERWNQDKPPEPPV